GVNQTNSSQFGGSGNYFLNSTEDSGTSWQDLTNEYKGDVATKPVKSDAWASSGLNVTSVYDLKFNPYSTDDIYAAYADIHGARSTDHGQSWEILPSTVNSIYDYAFADANTVFMVNGSQHDWPYLSLSLKGSGGVFKSTSKGDNWTRLTAAAGDFDRQYLSVGYDGASDTIYAGSQQKGILRSTDGGANWAWFNAGLPSKLTGHEYGMDLVIPQIEVLSNGNVYALVSGARPEITAAQVAEFGLQSNEYIADTSEGPAKYFSWINAAQTGIYFLDVQNGSQTWQLLRGTIDTNTLGNWNPNHLPWRRPMSFAVDPSNTNVLWMTDMEGRTWQEGAAGIWKSVDHGTTWKLMQKHTFALDINIAPGDSNYIAVAGPQSWGNGGMQITKDGGVTWTEDERPQLQNNGHSVCFDPVDTNKVIYGYSGGGMLFGDKL
ncbi:MAG: glycoside hydrolase, partial [Psychrosphaera sp.]|nr:glycoside hydrolase [Psychrosphaera sp.]